MCNVICGSKNNELTINTRSEKTTQTIVNKCVARYVKPKSTLQNKTVTTYILRLALKVPHIWICIVLFSINFTIQDGSKFFICLSVSKQSEVRGGNE